LRILRDLRERAYDFELPALAQSKTRAGQNGVKIFALRDQLTTAVKIRRRESLLEFPRIEPGAGYASTNQHRPYWWLKA
jgi:hypothetical protein